MGYVVSLFLMLLLYFGRSGFVQLFTDQKDIIAGGSLAFVVLLAGMFPQNVRVIYSGCLRGAGDVRYVAACSLISVTLVRPLFTYIMCYKLNPLLPGLYLAYTGPWIAFVIDAWIRAGLLAKRVKNGKYLYIKL